MKTVIYFVGKLAILSFIWPETYKTKQFLGCLACKSSLELNLRPEFYLLEPLESPGLIRSFFGFVRRNFEQLEVPRKNTANQVTVCFVLDQGWPLRGPRAACGPQHLFKKKIIFSTFWLWCPHCVPVTWLAVFFRGTSSCPKFRLTKPKNDRIRPGDLRGSSK